MLRVEARIDQVESVTILVHHSNLLSDQEKKERSRYNL